MNKSNELNVRVNKWSSLYNLLTLFFVPILIFAVTFLDPYTFKPLLLVSLVIGGICFFVLVIEFSIRLDYILVFLILFVSFWAYTAFPGWELFTDNNFKIIAFLIFLLILVVLQNNSPSKLKICSSRGQLFFLFLFLFFFIISNVVFNSKDFFTLNGFSKSMVLILSPILISGYFAKRLILNESILDFFLKGLVYIGIFCAFAGFMTLFFDLNQYSTVGTTTSIFKHPNATSSIYNFTVPPALYYLFFKKQKLTDFEKVIFISGTVLMMLSLLFTFSRTGIISVVMIFLIMSFYYSKKIMFIIIFLIPVSYVAFAKGILLAKGAGTALSRMGLLKAALDLLNSSKTGLLWGFGPLTTVRLFEKIKLGLGLIDPNNNPHNIILFFILQYGLIATVTIFIALLLFLFKSTVSLFKNKTDHLLLMSFAVCIPMIFKNMFEDLLIFPEFFQFYFFLIFFGFMVLLSNKNNFVFLKQKSQ